MNKRLKGKNGITLVALVITIVILLILAGISIQALTNQGLFAQAQRAKEITEQKTSEESATLREYEEQIGIAIGDKNYTAATTIAEAQTDDMLAKKVNSPIVDAYGNKITVPAGFKIKVDSSTNNATTVDKGIVIIDINENEFVWIPTGKIYTDVGRVEANAKTIELNRYTFDINGNPIVKNNVAILAECNYQELETSTLGNTTAKDIKDFKTKASATGSGGFYIGRYEARTGIARNSGGQALTTLTTKSSDYVYNLVTQIQAANLARNMYQNATKFTSDLMNSYAWDTATLFLQMCGDNSTYSKQTRVSSSLATTGTNNQITKDVQCNVYDMASNVREWTTETGSLSDRCCSHRGGSFNGNLNDTSNRFGNKIVWFGDYIGFRPILYVNI